jgi:uncharacterized protein YutE (UPF0331/DUF86 family)
MTVDRDLITRKLLLITRDLEALGGIAAAGVDAFLESRKDQAVVERYLEQIIGRMIDINYHVITESGHPPPSDYHASFAKLGELKILEPDFARRISRCAGLRNRLVHEYNEIDSRKVFESLETSLVDVPIYLKRIEEYGERPARS